jgi:AmpD protein
MNAPLMRIDVADGRLIGVAEVASPNFDARPHGVEIDLLVVHAISLPPGKYGGGYVEKLFSNCLNAEEHPYFAEIRDFKVSAHALIARDGKVTQFVPFTERAWHAGESSFQDKSRCNDYAIGVELEGCDDEPFTPQQYKVLAELTVLIMKAWPAITWERVVGHSDISPGRKTDPGPFFEWETLRRLVCA